jgi:hypothetical protein
MDDLQRVILATVSAESWAEAGTGEGRIEQLGTSLVVWQTLAVHEQLSQLLDELRAGTGQRATVTIDARWLLLNSDDLDRLLVQSENDGRHVDRQELAKLTRRPGSIRGITNCFSGQLVYLVSGTRRNFVNSYIPVVGSVEQPQRGNQFVAGRGSAIVRFVADDFTGGRGGEQGVGYQPIVSVENLGALLEIRPTLMRGQDAAVVDIKSTLTVPAERAGDTTAPLEGPFTGPVVDRMSIETQQLATSFRMPLGQPVLVGGLTYAPIADHEHVRHHGGGDDFGQGGGHQAASEPAENPQLYFVLELSRGDK